MGFKGGTSDLIPPHPQVRSYLYNFIIGVPQPNFSFLGLLGRVYGFKFLDASTQFCKRVCPSVTRFFLLQKWGKMVKNDFLHLQRLSLLIIQS